MSKILELADAYAGIPHDTYFRKEKEEARAVLAAEIERVEAENAKLRDALERVCSHGTRTSQQIDADWDFARATIEALREALSQQGEPVAWVDERGYTTAPLYAAAPAAQPKTDAELINQGCRYVTDLMAPAAQPLTDEQIKHIYMCETGWSISDSDPVLVDFARAIERHHGIGADK